MSRRSPYSSRGLGVGDQTGLVFQGRADDGRYLYASISVLGHWNTVALTQEQRVGLALFHRIANLVRPGTFVFPMTRQSASRGWGTVNGRRIWIQRPLLEEAQRGGQGLRTLAHELAHNGARESWKSHGPEFAALSTEMWCAVRRLTRDGTSWPKLDMRKLRDSEAPAMRKKRIAKERRETITSETNVERWEKEEARALLLLAAWESKLTQAGRMVEKHQRAASKAATWLAKARAKEGEQGAAIPARVAASKRKRRGKA